MIISFSFYNNNHLLKPKYNRMKNIQHFFIYRRWYAFDGGYCAGTVR